MLMQVEGTSLTTYTMGSLVFVYGASDVAVLQETSKGQACWSGYVRHMIKDTNKRYIACILTSDDSNLRSI
jgi:hypothetical protein